MPSVSPTLAKRKADHVEQGGAEMPRLKTVPWFLLWKISSSPRELGKGSIDVCACMHHTLVRDAFAKPLCRHVPTPAPEIAMGPLW